MGLEMTDGERCRRWNRQDLLKDGLPSGTRHAGGPGFWFGQVDEEEGVHYDGDTGREAGREQGEAMPVRGIPSLRDLWDNHMKKKSPLEKGLEAARNTKKSNHHHHLQSGSIHEVDHTHLT